MPRKPIADMTVEEMRERLTDQSRAATKRGVDYRRKQQKAGKIRFSCFVPKTLRGEVEQAVRQVLERHASSSVIPMHATETDQVPVLS